MMEGDLMVQYKAVSLFSGCGGFCEGIELANFQVLSAVENDRFAAETYRLNFPNTPLFEGDIRNFLEIPETHIKEYALKEVDLVFGGPPCQGFSQIGTRSLDDVRNDLYREFVRVTHILKPPVFLIENVPNIVRLYKGHYKELILEALRESGYGRTIYVQVIASDFGVPQDRMRIFFIGIRDDCQFQYDLYQYVEEVLSTFRLKNQISVWEAIGDLPADVVDSGQLMSYPDQTTCFSSYQESMRLDFDSPIYSQSLKCGKGISTFPTLALHNHHTKEIQERRLALISLLEPGKKANSLPESMWNGKRPEKWRRLHPDLPAYTLLANMHRDLSEFVHPNLNRWITVREAARLQSFHDGFIFASSEWQQLKQIGNAVPPLMGRIMGLVASAILDEIRGAPSVSVVQDQLSQMVLPFNYK